MDDRKTKNYAVVAIVLVAVIVAVGFTYAFMNQTLNGTKRQVITAGNLQLELQEKDAITLENTLPMYDEVGMIQKSFDFTLYNKTTENTKYVLKLEDATVGDSKLDLADIKYGLEKDGARTIGLLSNLEGMVIDEGDIAGGQTIRYSLRLWIDSSIEDEELIKGKTISYRIQVEAILDTSVAGWIPDFGIDGSKSNTPELTSGMIPVVYHEEEKTWVKADLEQSKYYNYEKQIWANAVTVTETTRENYMSSSAGTPISMDDINTMWVWIPRYEYQYTDLGNQYAGGTQAEPGEIKIRFISKEQETPSDSSIYKIPEGFQFGDENLPGFWMGKFETTGSINTACTTEECTTADLTVLPNNVAVSGQSVSSFFFASRSMQNSTNAKRYGFDAIGTRTMDVHMLKNTEWGSVAYLSQSRYGKYGNPNYEGVNKEIYQNKSTDYITGSSNGTPSTDITNTQVTYDTPDTGYGASTTGTIYGVYDMSGGAWDYAMGNYNQVSGYNSSQNSGFIGTKGPTSGGLEWPDAKYYDLYTSSIASEGYKAGDATYEVSGWYEDYIQFVDSYLPWFQRGGSIQSSDRTAGVFNFIYNGYGEPGFGMRLAIAP